MTALVQLDGRTRAPGFYSDDQERVPLYRQFNPNVDPNAATNNAGSHNYTTSFDEHSRLVSIGWNDEGIGWYGVSGAEAPVAPVDPFNTGVVDPSKAAIGEDTPGLVSLEDANSYNQIELTDADRNNEVTVSPGNHPVSAHEPVRRSSRSQDRAVDTVHGKERRDAAPRVDQWRWLHQFQSCK